MAVAGSANDAVAEYLDNLYSFDSVQDNETANAKVFTEDRKVVTTVVEKNIIGELWSEADFLTSENILSDGPGQQRISSLHTVTLLTKNSKLTTPSFSFDNEDVQLSGLWKSLGATPSADSMVFPDNSVDDDKSLEAVKRQLVFGTDVAAEVMKNCIASHNVIYSFLYSLLQFFRTKVVESEYFDDDAKGQDMMVCRVIEVCAEILALIQESKKATSSSLDMSKCSDVNKADAVLTEAAYLKATGAIPPKCRYCKTGGHGYSPILGQFNSAIRKEYWKRNEKQINEFKDAHKTVTPDNFITRSAPPNRKRAGKVETVASQSNEFICPTESSNIECALRKATFNSQVTSLMRDYLDSQKQAEQQQRREDEARTMISEAQRQGPEEAMTVPQQKYMQVIDGIVKEEVNQESREEAMEGLRIRENEQRQKNRIIQRQQESTADTEIYTLNSPNGFIRGIENTEGHPIREDEVRQRNGTIQRQQESTVDTENYTSNSPNGFIREITKADVEAAPLWTRVETSPVTRHTQISNSLSPSQFLAKIVNDVVNESEEQKNNIMSSPSPLPQLDFQDILFPEYENPTPQTSESLQIPRRDQTMEQTQSLRTPRRDQTPSPRIPLPARSPIYLDARPSSPVSPLSPMSPYSSLNMPEFSPSETTANRLARNIRLSERLGVSPSAPSIAERDRQTQKMVKRYISKTQKGQKKRYVQRKVKKNKGFRDYVCFNFLHMIYFDEFIRYSYKFIIASVERTVKEDSCYLQCIIHRHFQTLLVYPMAILDVALDVAAFVVRGGLMHLYFLRPVHRHWPLFFCVPLCVVVLPLRLGDVLSLQMLSHVRFNGNFIFVETRMGILVTFQQLFKHCFLVDERQVSFGKEGVY